MFIGAGAATTDLINLAARRRIGMVRLNDELSYVKLCSKIARERRIRRSTKSKAGTQDSHFDVCAYRESRPKRCHAVLTLSSCVLALEAIETIRPQKESSSTFSHSVVSISIILTETPSPTMHKPFLCPCLLAFILLRLTISSPASVPNSLSIVQEPSQASDGSNRR